MLWQLRRLLGDLHRPRLTTVHERRDAPRRVRKPIVFSSPGLTPDVCLTVFDQEFHVHSIILKLPSNFFRKFLDSRDKEAAPASSLFQYDYVSVLDADGTWRLEPSSKATGPSEKSLNEYPRAQAKNVEPFRKLLCSMYTRTYRIENVNELLAIIRLADYYCALPNLSGTQADEIILAAKKVQHAVLFTECFIHLVAILHDTNAYLWLLLNEGKCRLHQMILRAQQMVMTCLIQGDLRLDLDTMSYDPEHDDPEDCVPFFREILQRDAREQEAREHGARWARDFYEPIDGLMKNNLALDQTGFGAGQGLYKYSFLCTHLADEDMPWETTDFDW
ncbi:hypothetical protein N431DRAFT_545647 [Stipitochalara longipes BDJ]|nr:hypothetical protein N431DRAFT_545647 [Stipitochalara longipes BDJ]